MKFTLERTRQLAEKLRALPPKDPAEQLLDKQAVVKELRSDIVSLLQRGFTLEEVAKAIRGEGFDITTGTLKNYLQRAKRRADKGRKPGRPASPRRAKVASVETVTSAPQARTATDRAAADPGPKASEAAAKPDGAATSTNGPPLRSGKGAFMGKDRETY